MNLQQLRYVLEVARQDLNISGAAIALHTSQPGVSSQIKKLEEELGVDIFVRRGKRLAGLTEAGHVVVEICGRIARALANLKQVGSDYASPGRGTLSIATTHTQARYVLPPVLKRFVAAYPDVRLSLHQGNPNECCRMVVEGIADLAIATEAIADYPSLVMLPCYQWNRSIITPPDHPLLAESILSLEAVARYPIVTYDFAFTGRSQVNRAFAQRGLVPNVVLTAIDADVIKTYVALGFGVGIIASMAFDADVDRGLRAIDASHLFESATTRIGLPKNAWIRRYERDFIEWFAPQLSSKVIDAALGR